MCHGKLLIAKTSYRRAFTVLTDARRKLKANYKTRPAEANCGSFAAGVGAKANTDLMPFLRGTLTGFLPSQLTPFASRCTWTLDLLLRR